jgi:hypothetical protein
MAEDRVLDGELECRAILQECIAVPMLAMEYSMSPAETLRDIAYGLIMSRAKVLKTLNWLQVSGAAERSKVDQRVPK